MLDVGAVLAILVLPLMLLALFHFMASKKLAPPPEAVLQVAFAQFDFAGERGELALARGQEVKVVQRDKSGWSLVQLGCTQGWVPDAYLGSTAPERVFSVDVECAATGWTHDDRAPCRVGLVRSGQTVLDLVIRVDGLVSPLTPLTGLDARQLAAGVSLEEARRAVRAELGRDAVLVGQSIGHDVAWLGLREGEDFKRSVDLAELFRCSVQGRSRVLSLEHEALGLLGQRVQLGLHDPVEDAQVSLRLFTEWGSSPDRVQAARERLGQLVEQRQLPPRRRPPPRIDGVCMGRWSPECTCKCTIES